MKFLSNQKNTNKITNFPVECLLNNYIDKEFREAFEPLNLVDRFFLSPKFNITNSFITPSSKISNVLTIFGALLQFLMHICRFYVLNYVFKHFSRSVIVTVSLFVNEFMYSIAAILHYGNSIIQSKNSVLIMVKLQQAFRIVDLDKINILNHHKLWNRINVFAISMTYCLYTGIYVARNLAMGTSIISSIMLVFPQMIFDMNIIYFTRTTDLIGKMLTTWKNKIVASEAQIVNELGEIHDSNSIKSLNSAHKKLIEAFCLCKNVFQVSILFHVFQTFSLLLITVQIIIEFGGFRLRITNIATVTLNLKNIVLLITMSMACKKYYEIVKNVDDTCTQLITTTRIEDIRRVCKNVLRYSRAAGGELRAGGVLAVGAALPARVLAAVLAYTVVLLQFAFLSGQ